MKNEMKFLMPILLIIILILSSPGKSAGQKKTNLSAGIGWPDLMNIGIKYQVSDHAKTGFNIGYWPPGGGGYFGWNNLLSMSGSLYYYSDNLSDPELKNPFYGRFGFNTILTWPGDPFLNLNVFARIGREIYLNENTGFSIDGGIGFSLYNAGLGPLVLQMGIGYFYRF